MSWTGGKDSNLALLRATRDEGLEVRCLVCFAPVAGPGTFRAHPARFQEAQAQALGLPLEVMTVDPSKTDGDYRKAYASALTCLKTGPHSIEVIVTGDMALLGDQTKNFVHEACDLAGLGCLLPLWGADRGSILEELCAEGIRPFFTCIKEPWFDGTWIGRELQYESLLEIGRGLDLCGELGEYHTVVMDGPLYTHGSLTWSKPPYAEELEKQPGQKERWWVIGAEVNLTFNPRSSEPDACQEDVRDSTGATG